MRFEEQFKDRDESDVNVFPERIAAGLRKRSFHADFHAPAEFSLPYRFAEQ
jgi:hypothetical protein